MNVAELYTVLEDDLVYIEDKLRAQLASTQPMLEEASLHLLQAGGKRLRPVFVLLAGTFGRYDRERLSQVAVALELIHMATLVHDDVIDDADTRRGISTVKFRYGNRLAMYAGDFIFAQALATLSQVDDVSLHRTLAHAIERMCVGEIEQIRDLYDTGQSMRSYLRRIRRKTALLIEMSCALGAMAAGAAPQVVTRLRQYGYCAGMAFQITDDILDFTATPERLGKPVGGDLRQGNITAPVLYACRGESGSRLKSLISRGQTESEIEEALRLVRSGDAIDCSRTLAARYLERALKALDQLPHTPSSASLEELARFVTSRDH